MAARSWCPSAARPVRWGRTRSRWRSPRPACPRWSSTSRRARSPGVHSSTRALRATRSPPRGPSTRTARRLVPFGRHKGSALAVAVELLTGALAGAAVLSTVPDMYGSPEKPNELGLFFLALDPRALGPEGAGFAEAVHAVQSELNALP